MAPDSGASLALPAQMAERVAARTQCAEKVASGTTRRTSRRGSPSHLARYAAGKMATGESPRNIPRRRRTGTRCLGPGGAGHLDTISHEAVPFRRRDVSRASEKELNKQLKLIHTENDTQMVTFNIQMNSYWREIFVY